MPGLNDVKLEPIVIKQKVLYWSRLLDYYYLMLVVGGWLLQKKELFSKSK